LFDNKSPFAGPSALLIGNILARESYDKETREFSGNLANTKIYHDAALNYLENGKKWWKLMTAKLHMFLDLFCSSSWSMLFEDKAIKTEEQHQRQEMQHSVWLSDL
jgi:hypothetical protein